MQIYKFILKIRNDSDTDLDEQGKNLFDQKVVLLSELKEENYVQDVASDHCGGLRIQFNKGILEIIPDNVHLENELWRFFAPYSVQDHFVVTSVQDHFVTGFGIET